MHCQGASVRKGMSFGLEESPFQSILSRKAGACEHRQAASPSSGGAGATLCQTVLRINTAESGRGVPGCSPAIRCRSPTGDRLAGPELRLHRALG